MCFSATASFSAAAVLGAVGVMTVRAALTQPAARASMLASLPFAAFPLLFAAQQAVEGLLWLELARPEPGALRPLLVHAFMGYAEVFWPVFAPAAALAMEPRPGRRRMIAACLAVGVALAAYLLAMMILHPYAASAGSGHIVYANGQRYPAGIEVPYVLATTISLLFSSHRAVQRVALLILAGFAVAYVAFHHAYISVWCFFAAAISVLVYLSFTRNGNLGAPPRTI